MWTVSVGQEGERESLSLSYVGWEGKKEAKVIPVEWERPGIVRENKPFAR